MSWRLAATTLAVLGALVPTLASAQVTGPGAESAENVRLIGVVVDRMTAEPIPSASIRIVSSPDADAGWSGVSDEGGEFLTSLLPLGAYQIDVEAPPFLSISEPMLFLEGGVVDLRVEIVRTDYQLDPIVATARRLTRLERDGFYERLERGSGSFLTRADIEARDPIFVSDLFRTIAGVRVDQARGPLEATTILLRGCLPLIVLDRVVQANPVDVDFLLNPTDVEGIEVYRGAEVPIEYTGQTTCGVIMFWSREPIVAGGSWFPSWGRLLVGAGVVVFGVFATQ